MRVTVIAGGVGSARFCAGLVRVVDPDELTIVVNTGDDERLRGIYISPDVDTVLYHLAGQAEWERGWGTADESFASTERYRELVADAGDLPVDMHEWFGLGDRDLATKLFRVRLLEAGLTLTEATAALARAMGVSCHVLPMSDDPVRTRFRLTSGEVLDFHDYFVRRRKPADVDKIIIDGGADAVPAPGVIEAITDADVLIIPPSNPLVSIEPLLDCGGIRQAVVAARATKVAISPIVGGKAIKGPAATLLEVLGHEVSPVGVANLYRGIVDVFVCDELDADRLGDIEALGMRAVATDTIMRSPDDAARVAKAVLDAAG